MWTTILIQVLPSLLTMIGYIITKVQASDAVKAQFIALRKQIEDDMLIPTQGRDEFSNQDADHQKKQ